MKNNIIILCIFLVSCSAQGVTEKVQDEKNPEIVVMLNETPIVNNCLYDIGETVITGSKEVSFTIKNAGLNELILANPDSLIENGDVNFTISKTPDSSIPPGESSVFIVNYNPKDVSEHEIDITINSNDIDNEQFMITLKGKGCHGWINPRDNNDYISRPGVFVYSRPAVAIDINGNIVIAWLQGNRIYKSEFRNNLWSHPESDQDSINPVGTAVQRPSVAMDNNGNAIITWAQNNKVFKSEYRNGQWHHPFDDTDRINPSGSGVWGADVKIDDCGNAIICWIQNGMLYVSYYIENQWHHPQSDAEFISIPDMFDYVDEFSVGLKNGRGLIAWKQGSNKILKCEYHDGQFYYPTSFNDKINPDCDRVFNIGVDININGNTFIIWAEDNNADYNRKIYLSEYKDGSWRHPVGTNDYFNHDGSTSACGPSIKIKNNNDAIVVWRQYDGHDEQVYMAEYSQGVWNKPNTLQNSISGFLNGSVDYFPVLSVSDGGQALIAWGQYIKNLNKDVLFKSECFSDWVYPSNAYDTFAPDGCKDVSDIYINAAINNNHEAVIVWVQGTAAYTGVYQDNQLFVSIYK